MDTVSEIEAYMGLLALLKGPDDYWDRPRGDWPGRTGDNVCTVREGDEARQDANAAYLLGTKALRRGELDSAEAWFAVACDEGHPGAAFRAALTKLRRPSEPQAVVYVSTGSGKTAALIGAVLRLCAAAHWGHGDAQHLIDRLRTPEGRLLSQWEDGKIHSGGAFQSASDLAAELAGGATIDVRLAPDEARSGVEDTEFYPQVRELLEMLCRTPVPAEPEARPMHDHRVADSLPQWRGLGELVDDVCAADQPYILVVCDDALAEWSRRGVLNESAPSHFRTLAASWAEAEMHAAGLVHLEPYPGPSARWLCRCLACGSVTTPSMHAARRGRACPHCSGTREFVLSYRELFDDIPLPQTHRSLSETKLHLSPGELHEPYEAALEWRLVQSQKPCGSGMDSTVGDTVTVIVLAAQHIDESTAANRLADRPLLAARPLNPRHRELTACRCAPYACSDGSIVKNGSAAAHDDSWPR